MLGGNKTTGTEGLAHFLFINLSCRSFPISFSGFYRFSLVFDLQVGFIDYNCHHVS